MIVRRRGAPRGFTWALACAFPNLVLSIGDSTGVVWFDAADHTRFFPIDFSRGDQNSYIFLDDFDYLRDLNQRVGLDLILVDSAGADYIELLTWALTSGALIQPLGFNGTAGVILPGKNYANVAGLRLRLRQLDFSGTVSATLILPEITYIFNSI